MKKRLLTVCLICCFLYRLFADDETLLTGMDAYSRGDWPVAAEAFESALAGTPDDRADALYWLVMTYTSAQKYQYALNYANTFLEGYPTDERAAEVRYQKGRALHFDGRYEESSEVLYQFITDYPDHPKVPSAYYWIGENLYVQGSYSDARMVFNVIIVDYPHSGKVDAARYKIMQIDQLAVRDELLQMVSEVNTAAAIGNGLEDGRKQDEAVSARLTVLEEKIDTLSALMAQMRSEQENRRRQEEQRDSLRQQQELEMRQKELTELRQRTQTLKKMYEQQMKGVK